MALFGKGGSGAGDRGPVPSVSEDGFNRAFAEAWSRHESEYDAASKTRSKIPGWLVVLVAVAGVGLIIGGMVALLASFSGDFGVAIGLFVAGALVCVVAFLLWMAKKRVSPQAAGVLERFMEDFIATYLSGPEAGIKDVGKVDLLPSFSTRLNGALARSLGPSVAGREMECGIFEYVHASGDVARWMTPASVRAELHSSTSLSFALDGAPVNACDLRVVCVERRTVHTGKTTSTVYVPVLRFSGTVLRTTLTADYPAAMEIGARSRGMVDTGLSRPRYEMASDEFNRELDLRVGGDDGAPLRRALQPRMLATFCDLSSGADFGLVRTAPDAPTAVFGGANGLSLDAFMGRGSRFLKSKDDAYEVTRGLTVDLFELVADLKRLVDCDFLKNRSARSVA